MKTEKSVNNFFVLGSLITVGVIFIAILVFAIISHRTTIIFYNIPQQQSTGISLIIEENYPKKIKIVEIDDSLPLETHQKVLKKASLLIAQMDSQIENFAATNKKIQPFSQEILNSMPMAIASSVPKSNFQINFVPLLYDMYQVDIHYPSFLESGIKNLNTWGDLEQFGLLLTNKFYLPLIMPFADDKEFINIFGQILEALSSPADYIQTYNNFKSHYTQEPGQSEEKYDNLIQFLQEELQNPQTAVAQTLNVFKKMVQDKIIKQSVLTQDLSENIYYTDNQICGIFFTKLSDHRKIDRSAINNYKSIYTPSLTVTNNRNFSAYQYSAIQLKKDKKIRQLIQNLAKELQTELSTKTGLAPVQKNCQVPDHQSDDVRYWLAASNGPVNPLSCAIPSKKAQTQVAQFLLKQIAE